MRQFQYSAIRSNAQEHQLPGIRCGAGVIHGRQEFRDADEAFEFAASCCFLAGTWTLAVSRGKFHEERTFVKQ
jgi:hypothetical protein